MNRWNILARARTLVACCALLGFVMFCGGAQAQNEDTVAKPMRNGAALPGQEVLILRHQKIEKGTHDKYYELSRDGVWPWFEKIGTRVVGQWKVIHPDGSPENDEYDDGYRLSLIHI